MKRTVVLTSRENFVWSSMQEIIPGLEQAWSASAVDNSHEVRIVDVDEVPLAKSLPHLMRADQIVLTCFTHKLIRTAVSLREKFGIDSRVIIHLHNQASIGCWPYHAWGLGKWLRTDDTFISTCDLDAEALKRSFVNPRVEIVPFTFSSVAPGEIGQPDGRDDFVYVGRLSAQKNLHTLIYSFSMFLKKSDANLIFYGGEDNLGSPSMGLKSQGYADQLQELAKNLGISSKVIFKGQVARAQLIQDLRARHIFVSPSLHADENFGMAAFRSLAAGRKAVLSRWGGHADFAEYFPKQVFPVSVWTGGSGPWLDPVELTESLLQAQRAPEIEPRPLPERYTFEAIARRFRQIATQNIAERETLVPTEFANRILAKREMYAKDEPSRVFNSYEDPLCQPFLGAYGMRPFEIILEKNELRLHPWVRISVKEIVANDPHRGLRRWAIQSEGPVTLTDFYGARSAIDSSLGRALVAEGFAV